MLAALRTVARNRNLVRLFAGEFVSGIGDWLYLVALLVVVYRETNDPVLLGIVGGARIIPYVLLSVPAGIIIDRFDRRVILIVTDVLRGVSMIGLAVVAFLDGPVILVIALAILATCFAVFFRPTIGSYLPSLVRNEAELGPANSIFATIGEVTFIIGPAIGGLIIATTDLGWAFAINALTFLAPAVALWSLPSNHPRRARATTVDATAPVTPTTAADGGAAEPGAADGAPAMAADAGAASDADVAPSDEVAEGPTVRSILRPVVGMAIYQGIAGFFWGGLSVAVVILAVDRLGAGEDATGYLWAAIGVGGVIGAVGSSAIVLRPNLGPALVFGAAVLTVGFIGLGLVDTLLPALVAMAVIAAGALLVEVIDATVMQRVLPDAIRGRALGVLQTAETVTYAAGSFLFPVLLVAVGAPVLLPLGGVLIFGGSLIAFVLVGPYFRRTPARDAAADVLARVAQLPLFAGVSPAALEVALGRLVPVTVAAGEVVIREGAPADRFYVIESGRLAVDQRDAGTGLERRLRVMGPDEVFGELGLMHGAPRSATVTAETDARLLALDGPDFLELVNAGPQVSARMLDRYRATAAPRS